MDGISPVRTGNALALTLALGNAVCMLLVAITPVNILAFVFKSIFHGMSITVNTDFGGIRGVLVSIVTVAAIGWLLGALFGLVFNAVGQKKD